MGFLDKLLGRSKDAAGQAADKVEDVTDRGGGEAEAKAADATEPAAAVADEAEAAAGDTADQP